MLLIDPEAKPAATLDLSALPPAPLEDRELGQAAANDPARPAAPSSPSTPPISEEEKKRLETTGMAAVLIELGAKVAQRRWPVITFSTDEKHQVLELAVPVLMKYDIRSAWLDQYKEEIALGTFLFKLYQEKAAQVEKAKPEKRDGERPAEDPAAGQVLTTNLGDKAVADPYAALRR